MLFSVVQCSVVVQSSQLIMNSSLFVSIHNHPQLDGFHPSAWEEQYQPKKTIRKKPLGNLSFFWVSLDTFSFYRRLRMMVKDDG